jgi:hypothetical protein
MHLPVRRCLQKIWGTGVVWKRCQFFAGCGNGRISAGQDGGGGGCIDGGWDGPLF